MILWLNMTYLLLSLILGLKEPQDLLSNFAGKSNILSVPVAALIGMPMYIRIETKIKTMIPVARILIDKGVSYSIMVALIIDGARANIPEISLLGSIFKRRMVIAFVLSVFLVAVIMRDIFNIIMY